MGWMKVLADGLTGLRLVLSVVLVSWGFRLDYDKVDAAALLLLTAWTTDALDGPLARKSGVSDQSWIGRNDLFIDMMLAVGLLYFMCGIGLIHPLAALAYVLIWGISLWRYGRVTKPVSAAFQGPVYLGFVLYLLMQRMLVGRVMVIWVVAHVVVNWKRLIRRDVPQFVQGMRHFMAYLLHRAPEGEEG